MARKLSQLEVHNIKLLICEGFSQIDVARALDISQGSVSRICLGDSHRDVAWPNPAVGEKLARPRGKRSEIDEVQAQLASGIPQLPTPALPEPTQVIQATEKEAIEQARAQSIKREAMSKEIYRRAELIEKEMDAQFLKDMTITKGEPDQTDPKKMPTAWEVNYMPWEEVVKLAKENDIVQAASDEPDEIVQRAIGIVFHKMPEETWEAEGTLNLIRAVVKQLEETKK